MINKNAQFIFVLFLILIPFTSWTEDLPKGDITVMPFKGTTDQGKPFQLGEIKNHLTLVTMAYTSCKAACPMIVKKLKAVQEVASGRGLHPNVLVVSFDTEHDDSKRLAMFRKHQNVPNQGWTFVSSDSASTRKLSMILGIKFNQNPASGEIQHDNRILLVNEKGEIQKVLEGLSADPKTLFE